jgi:hypothetical protein
MGYWIKMSSRKSSSDLRNEGVTSFINPIIFIPLIYPTFAQGGVRKKIKDTGSNFFLSHEVRN